MTMAEIGCIQPWDNTTRHYTVSGLGCRVVDWVWLWKMEDPGHLQGLVVLGKHDKHLQKQTKTVEN